MCLRKLPRASRGGHTLCTRGTTLSVVAGGHWGAWNVSPVDQGLPVELTGPINQLDLTDTYRLLHVTTAENASFMSSRLIHRVDHVLRRVTHLSTFDRNHTMSTQTTEELNKKSATERHLENPKTFGY